MKRYHALVLAIGIAATAAPVQAQNLGPATSGPHLGPASMTDLRSMMGTIINDPVIAKRMKELMAANPQFKEHFDRMRATMSSDGMMMSGHHGMINGRNGSMDNSSMGSGSNGSMGSGSNGSMGSGSNGSMGSGSNGSTGNGNNGSMMNGAGSMHGQPASPSPKP